MYLFITTVYQMIIGNRCFFFLNFKSIIITHYNILVLSVKTNNNYRGYNRNVFI